MESSAEVKVLHRLVHSLAGLAGTLGFFSLCTHAQKLELQLAEILQDEKTPDTARWLKISRLQNQLEKLALIGLNITCQLIEMMGGIIGLESEVGVGNTFWIELMHGSPAKE